MGTVYENIKARRIELGMSQGELAEAVGYYDKSTISKVERGCIDLSLDKLKEIAAVLKCTASDLWDWSDFDYQYSGAEDANLLLKYHRLTADQQDLINNMIDQMLK